MKLRKFAALICVLCIITTMLAGLPGLAEPQTGESMATNEVQVEAQVQNEVQDNVQDDGQSGGQAVTQAPEIVTQDGNGGTTPTQITLPASINVLKNAQTLWQGGTITYYIELPHEAQISVYNLATDPNAVAPLGNSTDPSPLIYWDDNAIDQGNGTFRAAWVFNYTPTALGNFKLTWRAVDPNYPDNKSDYTDASNGDTITVYEKPTVKLSSLPVTEVAGQTITIVISTNKSAENVTLVNENGTPLQYIEKIEAEDLQTYKRWTCAFSFYDAGIKRIHVRASSNLGGSLETKDSDLITLNITPAPVILPTNDPNAEPPVVVTAAPTNDPAAGAVRFKQVPSASGKAGETITLNLDLEFAAADGRRINYTSAEFYNYVDYVEIRPEISTDAFPFVIDSSLNAIMIRSYAEMQAKPFKYTLQISPIIDKGTYTYNYTLSYRLKKHTDPEPTKTESGMLFVTEGAMPSASPSPTPNATADPMAGYVRFKQVPSSDAKVGGEVALTLDVEFAGYDGRRINYTDPEFYKYVDYVEVQPEIAADPYPFVVDESLERIIIHNYEEMQANPFKFNLKIKKTLANGTYAFNFTLRYRLKNRTDPEPDKSESGMVFVTGAKTPSTGGGGSSGGGGGTSTPTQAKLLIDSVVTNPENPQAGDAFDVILTLKNTNEKQYVQNIKVTYATDNDVLLPAEGSSSFYIDKIAAGKTCELKVPVKARADMPDAPVKFNVTMEYEDKRVTAVTATQVVVLNVKQVQKIKLDKLVQPVGDVMVGDSASLSMNVVNPGRTTLYNVSAAMLESDQFMTAGSAFVGNMETGSSKKVELEIYPMNEGMVEGTLRVTYEDANGKATNMDTPFSFYASAQQDENMEQYEPEIMPTPEPVLEATDILAKLPWWVYGAGGMLIICIVSLIAIAAHRKKANALMDYDDE